MNAAEFRATIARLGLSQTGAAPVLGVSPRTVRLWATSPTEIPGPVHHLLLALERDPSLLPVLRRDEPGTD